MKQIMMNTREQKLEAFGRLLDVMDRLRAECPWDAKQTNESLRANTIEETYELCEALIKSDNIEIKKELGDVLLHIVFYAKIGEEKQAFDIADVCNALCDKLIYRHPHIYGTVGSRSTDQVLEAWEELKLKEKDGNKTILGGVPASLPALVKAYRIQDKARNAGFDWEKKEDVWEKVTEELNELKAEIVTLNEQQMEAEFGDVMFSLINAARLYKINPDNALERTNLKFIARFNYVEEMAKQKGLNLKDVTLGQMDVWWNEAKQLE